MAATQPFKRGVDGRHPMHVRPPCFLRACADERSHALAHRHLQVLSTTPSRTLIAWSSSASPVARWAPFRHSAATARKAREAPIYSPLALQNLFLAEAFVLSSSTVAL